LKIVASPEIRESASTLFARVHFFKSPMGGMQLTAQTTGLGKAIQSPVHIMGWGIRFV
jgi:hypothetical protein